LRRGAKLAVIGDNRPRLYWAMAAAQALGAVPVPLYQDAVAEEMVYVLSRSTSCSRSARAARSSGTSSTTIRAGCAAADLYSYEEVRGLGLVRDHEHPGPPT
jgi:long-chain acyl-CoA synthetase